MPRRRISIFGLGRIGLTTAACFASRGIETVGFDTNEKVTSAVSRGEAPFFEPGLSDLVRETVDAGILTTTSNPQDAVLATDISFISVGTPSLNDGGNDLTHLKGACKMAAEGLATKDHWHLVVVKSTILPSTTKTVIKPMVETMSGKHLPSEFGLCFNPEFLREGKAVEDTLKPDRIVIGEFEKESGDSLVSFYREVYGELPNVVRTTTVNAELIKYANNSYLATKVSFINDVANLCQQIPEADIETVSKGIGLDDRIGSLFLRAGLGWGGSCLPKDVRAIRQFAKMNQTDLPVIEGAYRSNEAQPLRAVILAEKLLGSLKSKKVALLGLSFKPGTDDMRDAVSLKIVDGLLKAGAKIVAYDPHAMEKARERFGNNVSLAKSVEECITAADCCIIITEWDQFRVMTPEDFLSRMKQAVVIDGRRIYDPEKFSKSLKFVAIGRG